MFHSLGMWAVGSAASDMTPRDAFSVSRSHAWPCSQNQFIPLRSYPLATINVLSPWLVADRPRIGMGSRPPEVWLFVLAAGPAGDAHGRRREKPRL